ncbi:MAG: response regulator [Anaerolineae bacterium]|nr:response regulator [Anaerolineae bacterium]
MNSASGIRILIIDDEALIRRTLADYLFERGYETAIAADGMEGLVQARNERFDIVLVDLRMPHMDGLEVIDALEIEQPGLPVVVVSGTGVLSDAVEAMRRGAADYVSKPIRDMNEIAVVIDRVLEKTRLIAERDRYQRELEQLNRSLEAEVARRTADLKQANVQLEHLLAQIQEQARRVQRIINTVPEGVILLDADRRVVLTNPVAESDLAVLTGTQAKASQPRDLSIPDRAHSGRLVRTQIGQVLSYLGDRSLVELLSPPPEGLWHKVSQGDQRYEVIARPIRASSCPDEWVLVTRDVTQERAIQRQMWQQERLAVVGQLAAGVAHDFNNHLTAITGYAELLWRELDNDARCEDVQEILKAAKRSAELTRQLLVFSRKQVIQPVVLNLNDLISDMQKMLQRLIGENIDLVPVLDPKLGQVEADRGQIEQVVMNLVVNARDAMPTGGKLIIETANVERDDVDTRADMVPGSYVMLSVRDTGIGMDQETQSHLFEPFFTTKERGKGTGLGLATVYGIVRQSAGYIWFDSKLGKGTIFKVCLPRVFQLVERRLQDSDPLEAFQGSETIMLVEDDSAVRSLARRILQQRGYTILEAGDTDEALARCNDYGEIIHLVITDVVMPGKLSGREMAERIVAVRSERDQTAPMVLYMSGYTDDAIAQYGVLDPDVNFIQKPFTATALARKVREVLDSAAM